MARTDQQFPLRLPPELKEKLENACKESGRSKNAEAVYRLEQSFENNQSSYIEAFTEASVKVISHVMTSLKESGLSDEQIRFVLQGLKSNEK
ncbi:Arc family DNA-binding protein [Acinetobacter ursingii]|uniref:Arc family DNA-binding protein n=1 Tax=Acinetobacter ursingii TaxID=108980 RepID=UPI00124FDE26|nr:Arc family DNA-binding protein [Acinetobacter ursingii]MDU4393281.1 Arc family DNA-binding protein [Acinetobacter ursingii]